MFFKLSQDVSNRFSLNRFNEFSLKSRLYIVWSAWFLGEKVVFSWMMNMIGKWSDTTVLIIALSKSLSMMELLIMLSIVVAVLLLAC